MDVWFFIYFLVLKHLYIIMFMCLTLFFLQNGVTWHDHECQCPWYEWLCFGWTPFVMFLLINWMCLLVINQLYNSNYWMCIMCHVHDINIQNEKNCLYYKFIFNGTMNLTPCKSNFVFANNTKAQIWAIY
jgi:hypothetical protein